MKISLLPIRRWVSILIIFSSLTAQTTDPMAPAGLKKPAAWTLPDISFVATLLSTGSLVPGLAHEAPILGGGVALREAELIFQGAIYPGATAHLIFSYHDKEVEIEEGYASFSGIFPGGTLRGGRERIDLGRLNKIHPHAWSTIRAPEAVEQFLGELKGTGLGLSWLLPLPFYLTVDVSGWKMDVPEPETFGYSDWSATAKILSSFELGPKAELQIGASAMLGTATGAESAGRSLVGSGDLTFKAFPGSYSRWVFQNEVYLFSRNTGADLRVGFYNLLSWKPGRNWEWVVRHDLSQSNDPESTAWSQRALLGVTWSLSEATTLRLEYAAQLDAPRHDLGLQFVFGIGPHTHPIK